jgi:four helix bundle protein
MKQATNAKPYDLAERTLLFARNVIQFLKSVPRTLANSEISRQLVRSAGSVGANYVEASEAFTKKDFILRAKICRKEAKESVYWLQLVEANTSSEKDRLALVQEATELMRIFGSIVVRAETSKPWK